MIATFPPACSSDSGSRSRSLATNGRQFAAAVPSAAVGAAGVAGGRSAVEPKCPRRATRSSSAADEAFVPCDAPALAWHGAESVGGRRTMSVEPVTMQVCPAPDRVIHLPLGEAVGAGSSTTLLKAFGLELIRLVIPAGTEIPPHRAAGEITVQCIEGHVAFEHDGHAVDLHAGDLLYVCPQETHALKGIVDSSVLVTRLRPHADELPETFPPP